MSSITDELRSLAELLDKGLITREQFDHQRDLLLSGEQSTPTGTIVAPVESGFRDAPVAPEKILEYRIDSRIGEGGMGTVYLGTHEALGQRVAIKVLLPELAHQPELRTRFFQEARIQLGLRHPGIVQVHTANTESGPLALVMEYVEGEPLGDLIERQGRLPESDALPMFEQILDAVGHAHSAGIVHRDIKPSNILVQGDGRTKVTDFGIAKALGGAKLTRTGTAMGTAHYMSPEQVVGSREVDQRTDIYSLGATFYEVLTGQTPFESVTQDTTDSDYLLKNAHVHDPPPDPSQLVPDLTPTVAEALLRALEKAPENRFRDCAEFWEALSQLPIPGGEATGVAATEHLADLRADLDVTPGDSRASRPEDGRDAVRPESPTPADEVTPVEPEGSPRSTSPSDGNVSSRPGGTMAWKVGLAATALVLGLGALVALLSGEDCSELDRVCTPESKTPCLQSLIGQECYVWVEEPDPALRWTYEWDGGCVDCLAEGYGALLEALEYVEHPEDGSGRTPYHGEMVAGRKHGQGKLYWEEDGDLWYDGSFENNNRSGEGTAYYRGHMRYTGGWRADEEHGVGRMYIYSKKDERNQLAYDGEWLDGEQHGYGTAYWLDERKKRYQGEFVSGEQHGTGTSFFSDGKTIWYDGDWNQGERHGQGTMYDRDGRVIYQGLWRNGDRARD